MTGSEVATAINDAAANCASHMRTPAEAHLGAVAHAALMEYVTGKIAPDVHEICGDYDRPGSPWYGSRPSDLGFQSLTWDSVGGPVRVVPRSNLREAVIVMDTNGTPWIAEEK